MSVILDLVEIQERSDRAQNPGEYKEDAVEAWQESSSDVPDLLIALRSIQHLLRRITQGQRFEVSEVNDALEGFEL